jgi:hypothetical protein
LDGIAVRAEVHLREARALFRNIARYRTPSFGRKEVKREVDFEDFWIIAEYAERTAVAEYSEHPYSIYTIEEFEELLLPPKPPPRANVGSKARTRIGKAVIENQKQIAIAIPALDFLISDKIAALQGQLPNSVEAIAQRDVSIAEYMKLRDQLRDLAAAVSAYQRDDVKERTVIEAVTTFSDGIQAWWTNMRHRVQHGFVYAVDDSLLTCWCAGKGSRLDCRRNRGRKAAD